MVLASTQVTWRPRHASSREPRACGKSLAQSGRMPQVPKTDSRRGLALAPMGGTMSDNQNNLDSQENVESEALPKVDEQLLLETLDAIRPSLVADGGDIEFRGVDDEGVVSVKLTGSCAGCPLSSITLSMGVERILKEHVPGVTRVKSVM